jgi:GTPase SAR1 family protein
MNQEWVKELYLKENIYLGDLTDKDKFKYYYLSGYIKDAIFDFEDFTSDIDVFHPILLAGDAGSGKTSLINYMYENNYFKGYPIILNLDRVISNKSLFESLLDHLEDYFFELSKINEDIDKYYINYQEKKSCGTNIEKIRNILHIHHAFSKEKNNRQNKNYQNLIIIVDQIDMLNISEIEKRIKEIFSILEESHYVHKIICARHDTLKICRTKSNSYFATMFRRQIEIMPSRIEDVIRKRLECATLGMHITKDQFGSYFDSAKIRFIEEVSSDNVRLALDIFSLFFKKTKPGRNIKNVNFFIQFLMKNNYIPNINDIEYMESGVSVPCVRLVFDTIMRHNVIDLEFSRILNQSIKKSLKSDVYCIAITKQNIQNSIKQLKDFLMIKESIYNHKQFDLTKKGRFMLYIIINTDFYNSIYPYRDKAFNNFRVTTN